MEEWGNARANAYYEANLPNHVLKPKEGDSVRKVEKFIRDKYEFKRYVASSVPDKSKTSQVAAAAAPASASVSTKSNPAPATQQRSKFVYGGDEEDRPHSAPAQAPVAKRPEPVAAPVSAPVAKAAAPAVDLLNFMDEPVTPAPVAQAPVAAPADSVFGFAPAPAQVTPQNGQFASQAATAQVQFASDFSNFGSSAPNTSAPSTASSFSNFSGFDNFGTPATTDSLNNPFPPQGAAPAAAKPQASADSILSLFNPPAPTQPAYGMAYGMPAAYGQQYPPQQAMYGQQAPQHAGYYAQQAPVPAQPQQAYYHQPQAYSPYPGQAAPQQAYPPSPYGAAPYGQAPGYGQTPPAAAYPPQQPAQPQAFADLAPQWN